MENNTEAIQQNNPLQENDLNANKQLLALNLNHLSIVISNIALFASISTLVLAISGLITFFAMAVMIMLLFAFLIFATVFTLGIIYMISGVGKMWSWFEKIGNQGVAITNFIYKILPFVSAWAFASCVLAILALALINKEKKVGRIIATSIFAVLTLIISIFSFAGVLK